MSAKQPDPMVNVNFRVPSEMHDEILRAAKIAGEDKADIVRRALAIGMTLMQAKGYNMVDLYLSGSQSADAPQPKPLKSVKHTHPENKRNA